MKQWKYLKEQMRKNNRRKILNNTAIKYSLTYFHLEYIKIYHFVLARKKCYIFYPFFKKKKKERNQEGGENI